jgi:hypothetical protein
MEIDMASNVRELKSGEIEMVSGGMKWTPVDNPDVIDARGGQFKVFGFTVTLDVHGDVSSISR